MVSLSCPGELNTVKTCMSFISLCRLNASRECGCDAEALLRQELNSLHERLFRGLSSLFNELLEKKLQERVEVLWGLQQRAGQ